MDEEKIDQAIKNVEDIKESLRDVLSRHHLFQSDQWIFQHCMRMLWTENEELKRELSSIKSSWDENKRLRDAIKEAFPELKGDACDAPMNLKWGVIQLREEIKRLSENKQNQVLVMVVYMKLYYLVVQ